MRTVIDQDGRLVLSPELLHEAGLEPGTPVDVEASAGELSVKAAESETRLVEHNGRMVIEGKWVGTEDDALNLVHKLREERDRHISGI